MSQGQLFILGDIVRIQLRPTDAYYDEFNDQVGSITAFHGGTATVACSVGTIILTFSQMLPIPPATPTPPSTKGYHYTIELDQTGYVELMQLVLRHGRSHEDGYKLSEPTIAAISGPEIRYN